MFIRKSEKTAIITADNEISYNSVLKRVSHYSDVLGDMKGERVLIISENRPEYIYAIYGIWSSGGTVAPVDFMSTPAEIAYIINDCKPTAVFTSAKCLQLVNDSISASEVDELNTIIFEQIPNDDSEGEVSDLDFTDRERTALLIYTSGTTGSPKGVMLSFTNILANTEQVINAGYFSEDERVLMILPLHHIYPIMGTVIAVFSGGGSTAIVPSLDSEDILKMMEKAKPTMLLGVPRFFEMLIRGIMHKINSSFIAKTLYNISDKLNNLTFSKKVFNSVHQKFGGHVNHIICGGAKLDPVVFNKFKNLGFLISEGYGMSEAAPMITFPKPGTGRAGCVGTELVKGSVRIVDGEIVASGKNIMKGYYNRPEETAEVLKDGWLYTGDLGHFDKQGRLYVTGRKKEIIVLPNGKNINPIEIEKALEEINELVIEAAVLVRNNALTAVIRPDDKILSERQIPNLDEFVRWEIIDKFNKTASHHKKLLDFVLVHEPLPRTRLEKLQRFKLEKFLDQRKKTKKKADIPKDEVYTAIAEYLNKFSENKVYPDDHVEIDLGLDSLDKIELAGFISKTFKTRVSEKDLHANPTVRELAKFVETQKDKVKYEPSDWKELLKENIQLDLPKSAWYHIWFRFYLLMLMRFFFKLRYHGYRNIPQGPVIFAPNHQSVIDGVFVVGKISARQFRRTYFFAKFKHFRRGWRRFLANRNNIIIMKEGDDVINSIKRMASVLKKGRNIIIFPEGTRTRDGEIAEFKQTFAILATELNVPVVPVAIKGAYEAFPRNRKLPYPFKRIDVTYLPAIHPEGYTQEEFSNAVKRSIKRALNREDD